MNFQKLELHIAQVERVIRKCKKKFKDPRRQEIYDNLKVIFKKIKASEYKNYDNDTLNTLRKALNIVFSGVVNLDFNKESDLPRELIFCLNLVLTDWIPKAVEEFFIVIAYNDTLDQFYIPIRTQESVQAIDRFLDYLFGVGYKQALITISKPRFLMDDFLGSVPVYHELGHFIDQNYQITDTIFIDKSFLAELTDEEKSRLIKRHYAEHFADLFAAQYIGRGYQETLSYIGHNIAANSTHPSTTSRMKVIDTFLTGTGDPESVEIVERLKQAARIRTNGIELKVRSIPLTENPFEIYKPIVIDKTGRGKIHSLISEGWAQWSDRSKPIHAKYSQSLKCCLEINKLIKSSIRLSMEG